MLNLTHLLSFLSHHLVITLVAPYCDHLNLCTYSRVLLCGFLFTHTLEFKVADHCTILTYAKVVADHLQCAHTYMHTHLWTTGLQTLNTAVTLLGHRTF